MKRFLSTWQYLILLFVAVFLFDGCAAFKKQPPEDQGPETLLSKGLKQMKDGNFGAAARLLQTVKDRYPYSESAKTASLKLADTLFKRGEYDVAFDLYDEFERLHPKDKNAPYVSFQKGMCYFERIRSFDRDQTFTNKARQEFERFIIRYPKSEYYNEAGKKLKECLTALCKYELYVGHFYFKSGKYRPALERFTYLIENYPDVGQYHEALEYISKCKQELALEEKKTAEN